VRGKGVTFPIRKQGHKVEERREPGIKKYCTIKRSRRRKPTYHHTRKRGKREKKSILSKLNH